MRKYGKDIREDILLYLKNNLNNKLAEIDNKYGLNGNNLVKSFSYAIEQFSLPCCVVYTQGSKVVEFSDIPDLVSEVYDVKVEIIFKETNISKTQDMLDSYEEALKELFSHPNFNGCAYVKYNSLEKGYYNIEKQGGIWLGLQLSLEIRI